ncbi:hypothetical protein [Nocardia huaxiensis]|uniref:Uncharacterized protein n=1 Tax=Nocardia huaxiensis TaxID=2755382 RepID=A0A7D6V936_9NOCA|nr:hypothetical protein [Nocardia huaxiensis]QLY30641.1 hypothetical protein H0264_37000 [Nocardia huaxiensis]UFS95751.1 hypothetical protein LPY97_34670 [Nocardia huaxiensis]
MFRRRAKDRQDQPTSETPPPQGDSPDPPKRARAKEVSKMVGKMRKTNERNRPRPRTGYDSGGGGDG